jgi:antitoxin VapB
MTETKRGVARIFRNGRSQAVRLPKEFRFAGEVVSVRRVGKGVLLEPMPADAEAWFAELDRLKTDDTFLAARRKQPKPPRRKVF